MAKFEIKHLDATDQSFIKTQFLQTNVDNSYFIQISGYCESNDSEFDIFLDKSTAIKFAKTLRTEINKITESEVNNG